MVANLCQTLGIHSKRRMQRDAESMEARMLSGEMGSVIDPSDMPLFEGFAPGVYLREITMPAGSEVLGHEHKTAHWNIITKGRCTVMMDGKTVEFKAGDRFVSKAGVRKALKIHEETVWITIHPTEERDKATLEEMLIVKSDTFLLNEAMKTPELIGGAQ